MGQGVTVPAAKPPNTSSIPESDPVKGREPAPISHPLTSHKTYFALAELETELRIPWWQMLPTVVMAHLRSDNPEARGLGTHSLRPLPPPAPPIEYKCVNLVLPCRPAVLPGKERVGLGDRGGERLEFIPSY